MVVVLHRWSEGGGVVVVTAGLWLVYTQTPSALWLVGFDSVRRQALLVTSINEKKQQQLVIISSNARMYPIYEYIYVYSLRVISHTHAYTDKEEIRAYILLLLNIYICMEQRVWGEVYLYYQPDYHENC